MSPLSLLSCSKCVSGGVSVSVCEHTLLFLHTRQIVYVCVFVHHALMRARVCAACKICLFNFN